MKLNICHKKEDNVLFSIDLNKNNDKESKTIVFAPNGVGKTSITRVVSNYKTCRNVNNFFLSMDKEKKEVSILVFKEKNYRNNEIRWENICNYNNLLTKRLLEQIHLEREWGKCKMILGPSIIPSGILVPKTSYNYIGNCKNTRIIPNTRNFHNTDSDLFNEHHLLINKERIDSIKKLISWHLTFINTFQNKKKQQQLSLMFFLKTQENKYTHETIQNIIQKNLKSLIPLRGSLNKFCDYDDKPLCFIYKSWEFMLFIYNQYFLASNVPIFLYFDDIENNIEMYKESLINHNKEVLKIEKNLVSLKDKFKFQNWMPLEDYNENLEKTKENIKDYLIKEKGVLCNFKIEHNRPPFSFVIKIKPIKSLSEGELKANTLLIFLNLIFHSKKLDLLILDDPVTSLDYFHTSTIITWLKDFKSSFLLLTHNFSFFSKFMGSDMNRLSKDVYVMDKFNNEEVFSIKLEKSDSGFFLGKFVNFWEERNLSVDEFIFTFDLVYELVKSFSIEKNECRSFLNKIDYYIRHSNKKLKKAKTIRTFVNESEDLLYHYKEISLVNTFKENYKNYLKKLNKSNSIIDIDLENYVVNWDKKSIDKYKEKIKNKTLSFSNYLTMKHLLIRCCNAKYKIIKNKNTNNKSTKAIYDQIKSLKHFESLRFIPLLEISCETLITYIDYLNEQLNIHKKK